jgi:hypothetical protein
MDTNLMLKTNKSVGKGVRFCVINAGTEDGFVENAEKIVYKIEITAQIFEEWLENQLMPNVPPNSIVIYDNCSVHSRKCSKTPTMQSNLKTIKEWILINEIPFDDNLNKKLLEIVKRNPRKPRYYVDDIITKFGCDPLRLPLTVETLMQ